MYQPYRDIRSRLGKPLWHDWHGVPRYEPYRPGMQNIYAKYEALMEIRCQTCGTAFLVGSCANSFDVFPCEHGSSIVKAKMPTLQDSGFVWYGDAPWHDDERDGGGCSGTTMTTDWVRIVEFWEDQGPAGWTRVREREIAWT